MNRRHGTWIVSRCLLGELCRYDGKTKENQAVEAYIKGLCGGLHGVCPELESGLGCPRPPMHVRKIAGRVELPDVHGGEHIDELTRWMETILPFLSTERVCGFILKARSPSCGYGNVPVEGDDALGDGVFAAAVHRAFPHLPILNEGDVELLMAVESRVRALLESTPACHDWEHTERVRRNARLIMEEILQRGESVNWLVVELAAVLHDIGRLKELQDHGQTDHAVYGAGLAETELRALGVTDDRMIHDVCGCVRSHRYRQREGGSAPGSLEARIVFDADKLDSIGAIGIGRSFHFAGREGARVHNLAAEALGGASYSREDSAYREYLVKLRHVRDCMLTEVGRELAEKRHEFMVSFFSELNEECYGETPGC